MCILNATPSTTYQLRCEWVLAVPVTDTHNSSGKWKSYSDFAFAQFNFATCTKIVNSLWFIQLIDTRREQQDTKKETKISKKNNGNENEMKIVQICWIKSQGNVRQFLRVALRNMANGTSFASLWSIFQRTFSPELHSCIPFKPRPLSRAAWNWFAHFNSLSRLQSLWNWRTDDGRGKGVENYKKSGSGGTRNADEWERGEGRGGGG